MLISLRVMGIACAVLSLGATTKPTYRAAVVADGISGRSMVVLSVVNRRVPAPSVLLRVEVEPAAPPQTPVHWSSPDGRNEFANVGLVSLQGKRDVTTTLDATIGIVPDANEHGPATILADIGAPVHRRVKVVVQDEVAIGFGCNAFMRDGPSVRIVDGVPQRSSLADSDIAVLGPTGLGSPGHGYGCWDENVDSTATTYRLVFNHGGRVAGEFEGAFIKQLPIDSVGGSPLDVLSGDGHQYRLHVTLGACNWRRAWLPHDRLTTRKNPPLGRPSGSDASHTGVSAASSTERVAFQAPISVFTQPGVDGALKGRISGGER